MSKRKVLVTGATGYVGGRLLHCLASGDCELRAVARRPQQLSSLAERGVEVVQGDMLDPASLDRALAGVDTAYYLVHSLGSGPDYARLDREAAGNFVRAAEAAGLKRIIYLGGLGDEAGALSDHLSSRQEVGRLLRSGGVQVIELRASIVLGSGSVSFEMIRALSERLPVMITPRWVSTMAQPIAIDDLLSYLTLCLDHRIDGHRIYEIGGPDQVSYLELMREYSRQRGLRRLMIRVPVLTPRLSSLWLALVTPLYATVGRALIDGIRNATVVRDRRALEEIPVRPMGASAAIAGALRDEDREMAETRWSEVMSARVGVRRSRGGQRFGNRLVDYRRAEVAVTPRQAFVPIERIGGANGWYFSSWLWRLRGFIDLLLGGVGLRRGRPDPERLGPGDVLDSWRVEAFEPDRLLRLRAEMKLPGRAWLQWEVTETHAMTTIHQSAIFDPLGIGGLLYWHLVCPLHKLVFAGLLRGIVRRSSPGRDPATAGSAT